MLEYVVKVNGGYVYPFHDILADGTGSCGAPRSKYETGEYRILSAAEAHRYYEDQLNALCGKWEEITGERYDEMLSVLPPVDWRDDGFFLGELYMADVGFFFQERDGKYYESKQRTSCPRDKILAGLKQYLEKSGEATR
jgi:hypothetical protein